jgi:outer membrane murein-binding lipoprotein Lpp
MITGLRHRRQLGLLAAALVGAVSLAGCASDVEGQAAPASSSASSSDASSSASESSGALDDVADLSAGLLPAEAFGPGAQATPITADQIEQGQSTLGGLVGGDVTITPESCAPAVKQVQPGLEDLAGLGAQTVTVGSRIVAEVLLAGAGVGAGVEQLSSAAAACPQATISSPSIGEAQIVFTALEVPDLGDGSAGVTMTVTAPGPTGQPTTVPLLLGMARDGDRLVSLTATDETGVVDPVAFAALLQQAFEHQADALD